ncbi:MAG: hypothetical protein ACRDWI_11035 [Jiangellaceae bacterium]
MSPPLYSTAYELGLAALRGHLRRREHQAVLGAAGAAQVPM